MDVVKNDEDDEVVEKIVDNPQTTTIRSDIGVNQGEDDQQQYRHITDDTEQFMAEENDANKEPDGSSRIRQHYRCIPIIKLHILIAMPCLCPT